MGKQFQHFFADNSSYIMIFWILQQRWGMLVVLGGHPVNIGDFSSTIGFCTKALPIFVTKDRFDTFFDNRICHLILVLQFSNIFLIILESLRTPKILSDFNSGSARSYMICWMGFQFDLVSI